MSPGRARSGVSTSKDPFQLFPILSKSRAEPQVQHKPRLSAVNQDRRPLTKQGILLFVWVVPVMAGTSKQSGVQVDQDA